MAWEKGLEDGKWGEVGWVEEMVETVDDRGVVGWLDSEQCRLEAKLVIASWGDWGWTECWNQLAYGGLGERMERESRCNGTMALMDWSRNGSRAGHGASKGKRNGFLGCSRVGGTLVGLAGYARMPRSQGRASDLGKLFE
jgi:hypothetical protein